MARHAITLAPLCLHATGRHARRAIAIQRARKPVLRASLKVKAAAAITLLFVGMMALIASVQTRSLRADLVEEVADQQAALVARAARDLDQKLETNLRA